MGCGSSIQGSLILQGPASGERQHLQELYSLGAKLGEGTCGQVYTARAHIKLKSAEGRKCAVKVVPVRDGDGKVDRQKLQCARQEATLWQRLGLHPHCLALYESFLDVDRGYCYISERCVCSLADWVKTGALLGFMDLSSVLRQVLMGIEHVHRTGLVHRDIKPENILFGGPDGSLPKLADFGLTVAMPKVGLLKGIHGSAPYMSPEMLLGAGYDGKTDVWSLGAMAYVVVYDDFVYRPPESRTPADVMNAIMMGSPAPAWESPRKGLEVPPGTEAFIRAILVRSARLRPTSDEALLLPYFSGTGGNNARPATSAPTAPAPPAHLRSKSPHKAHSPQNRQVARGTSRDQPHDTKENPTSGSRVAFAPLLPDTAAASQKASVTGSHSIRSRSSSLATESLGSLPSCVSAISTVDSLQMVVLASNSTSILPLVDHASSTIDSLQPWTSVAASAALLGGTPINDGDVLTGILGTAGLPGQPFHLNADEDNTGMLT